MKTLIISIIVFGIIIFVHEFGHYIFAKLSGIRVEEFALGMGPKFIGKRWGETLHSVRVLPLGGYCKMAGETGDKDYEKTRDQDPRRFDQKPVLARMSVVLAGPVMNFLLAVVLFAMIFVFIGVPQEITNEIGTVMENSPAQQAGLLPGDRITGVNDMPVHNWQGLVTVIHQSPGENVKLTIDRDGKQLEVQVIPQLDPEVGVGMIGISAVEPVWVKTGIFDGIKNGYAKTYEITRLTLEGLVQMITGKVSAEGIAGPVGIIQLIQESARYGIIYLVNLTALISINLGLLNLLPIPALDGSRLLFLAYEGLRGRPVNPEKENFVHLVGFVLLMLLMAFVTYRDILRLFV